MKKVLVGGSFDILHSGHIRFLKAARKFGDYLIVQIPFDGRVAYKKGKERPIFCEKERKLILESLRFVDKVIIGRGNPKVNTIFKTLERIKPEVYVRGNDVNPETLEEEKRICQKYSIEMKIIKRKLGIHYSSTTDIINNNF